MSHFTNVQVQIKSAKDIIESLSRDGLSGHQCENGNWIWEDERDGGLCRKDGGLRHRIQAQC